MKSVFFSKELKALPRWKEAFPNMLLLPEWDDELIRYHLQQDSGLFWLDIATFSGVTLGRLVHGFQEKSLYAKLSVKFCVMFPLLSNKCVVDALKCGASGSVHRFAIARQLQEVASVIESNGVWVGRDFLDSLIEQVSTDDKLSGHFAQDRYNEHAVSLLTDKELEVAYEVSRGQSNKEISETLSVSERTVKAHLTDIFKKLNVRDRVQLALLMNNIQFH
jgi:DNA-binding NarL/FixJ family response regulator